MKNNPFYQSMKKALKNRDAKSYFALCTHLQIKPEDEMLYYKGREIVEDLRSSRSVEDKLRKENFG